MLMVSSPPSQAMASGVISGMAAWLLMPSSMDQSAWHLIAQTISTSRITLTTEFAGWTQTGSLGPRRAMDRCSFPGTAAWLLTPHFITPTGSLSILQGAYLWPMIL